jgi:hypothetical protein
MKKHPTPASNGGVNVVNLLRARPLIVACGIFDLRIKSVKISPKNVDKTEISFFLQENWRIVSLVGMSRPIRCPYF